MRIGIFTDSYKPYTSGVVNSIVSFKEELSRWGHEIFIFAPNYFNHSEEEPGVYRMKSLPSPTNSDYSLAIPYYPKMQNLLKKIELDLIHAHSPFILGQVGLHCAQKQQLPLIFTYHTMYDQYVHYVPMAHDLVKKLIVQYSKYYCNKCDHVIVPSSIVKRKLNAQRITTPMTVIPTGVQLQKFATGDSGWLNEHYPATRNKKILLFVGRLTKEKNLEFLIEAFKDIHEQKIETVLVLVAGGPFEEKLKDLAVASGLILDEDIIFTGVLPYETLGNVYHSAHLFVFTSKTETQGLVLLEAMASGLPAVAVRAGGVEDMVDSGQNGMLCAERRLDFKNAVCSLLDDEQVYMNMVQQAYKKAEKLSSIHMARKMEKLYRMVVNDNNKQSLITS
ncbi:MAG: glycosyltransferase family 4 protein [Syntrophomonadaceae bacterium]|jgi:glycosyltransferase involved in cell wall biosynthesis|nr:glycosyltransferase family 4 protein [Syntrophomonadaceae bacterium]